jgi:predicted nucleic acid-binding protein
LPPAGRPASPRGVRSFEDASNTVPNEALFDTSFVVEALIVSQPLHSVCNDYLVRFAGAGSTIVYSGLLELELAETAFQIALKERHPKDWKRFRSDGRARRRARTLLTQIMDSWAAVLAVVPSAHVAVEEARHLVPGLMSDYGLASYDALHVGSAIEAAVTAVVTTDAGFAAAPASLVELYVDSSRVASCRRRRA